jgi:hypothetical protein
LIASDALADVTLINPWLDSACPAHPAANHRSSELAALTAWRPKTALSGIEKPAFKEIFFSPQVLLDHEIPAILLDSRRKKMCRKALLTLVKLRGARSAGHEKWIP